MGGVAGALFRPAFSFSRRKSGNPAGRAAADWRFTAGYTGRLRVRGYGGEGGKGDVYEGVCVFASSDQYPLVVPADKKDKARAMQQNAFYFRICPCFE